LRAVTVVGLALTVAITAIQGIILPVYFTQSGQAGRTGLTLSVLALGMILGAGFYAGADRKLGPRRLILIGAVVTATGVWTMAGLFGFATTLVSVALVGGGAGILSSVFGVLSLELAVGSMQGRVLGNQNALTMGFAPFVALGAALLIETIGIAAGLGLIAALLTAALAWGTLTRSMAPPRPPAQSTPPTFLPVATTLNPSL
jgi:MFS family permease